MEIATIQGQSRTRQPHHGNERLRRAGLVPAVIYGHGQAPEMVSLSRHDTELALAHGQHVVKLVIDGGEQQYLIKQVQFDHLHKTPVHVDLMRVDLRERVKVKVPLELRGTPRGTSEGGALVSVLTELEVECELLRIPESIRVRVEHLEMNQQLKVKDIEAPEGVTIVSNPEDIIAIVQPPRVVEEVAPAAAEPAEGGAEPEIISKGKEEKEEAGE
jgi:large subunit ribosomal protein L25